MGDETGMREFALLSGSIDTKQRMPLQRFIPSENDVREVLDSFSVYLTVQYAKPICKRGFNEVIADSVINTILQVNKLNIDTANCFIDADSNKLITGVYPVYFLFAYTYPFTSDCRREDNRAGFKITYASRHERPRFLSDELSYIGSADFDNDGKDEYIFWYCIHNTEGYVLFYDDFRKKVEYTWHYH